MTNTNIIRDLKAGKLTILPLVNGLLIVVMAGLLTYIGMLFGIPEREAEIAMAVAEDGYALTRSEVQTVSARRPFSEYEENIKQRNLFLDQQDSVNTEYTAAMEKALPALHTRIKLIGILMDKNSTAIVEDLKERQTHFLSKGERIGEVQLEDIQEDKVIFLYDNERVEMTP